MRVLAVMVVTACYAPRIQPGAPCTSTEQCPDGQICTHLACGIASEDAGPDVAAARDADPDAPAPLESCREIKIANPGAASGPYVIDPDGPGGHAPVDVTCDMVSDGGGWTIVFVAGSSDLTSPPTAYSVDVPFLLATYQGALVAFRDANLVALPGAAVLALPPDWRTAPPFAYQASDVPIQVRIDTGSTTSAVLRYGQDGFEDACGTPWLPADPVYGRICFEGTSGPYFSGFSAAGTDYCSTSAQNFITTQCSPSRQFSIAVR